MILQRHSESRFNLYSIFSSQRIFLLNKTIEKVVESGGK